MKLTVSMCGVDVQRNVPYISPRVRWCARRVGEASSSGVTSHGHTLWCGLFRRLQTRFGLVAEGRQCLRHARARFILRRKAACASARVGEIPKRPLAPCRAIAFLVGLLMIDRAMHADCACQKHYVQQRSGHAIGRGAKMPLRTNQRPTTPLPRSRATLRQGRQCRRQCRRRLAAMAQAADDEECSGRPKKKASANRSMIDTTSKVVKNRTPEVTCPRPIRVRGRGLFVAAVDARSAEVLRGDKHQGRRGGLREGGGSPHGSTDAINTSALWRKFACLHTPWPPYSP